LRRAPRVNGIINGVYLPFLSETWKKCKRCGCIKPRTHFNNCTRAKDGLQVACRDCDIKYKNQRRKELRDMPKVVVTEKACSRCGAVKPIDDFPVESYSVDGRKAHCKECHARDQRERYARNPEKYKAYEHRRYKIRRQEAIGRARRWYRENTERRREWHREYYLKNSDRIKGASREWYENNQDRVHETRKLWRESNREKCRAISKRHKMIRRSLPGLHTEGQWVQLCLLIGGKCPRCGKRRKLTEDHIIPITWDGSTDWIDNIQPLCRACNASKSNREDTDYRTGEMKEWARKEMEGIPCCEKD